MNISATQREVGNFWIHRIDGNGDITEIRWKEKMNGPNLGRSTM